MNGGHYELRMVKIGSCSFAVKKSASMRWSFSGVKRKRTKELERLVGDEKGWKLFLEAF